MPVELPEVEPELPPLELPEPMPLDGEVVELPPLLPPLELPLVPPEAPEPDLLKYASHSARETWPSLFVSTDEKLGVELLVPALLDGLLLEPPDAALPPEDDAPDDPLDTPDEPLELEPDAAGDDEDLSLLLLEELCAIAALESAKSAAATAALSTLRFNIG